MTVSVYLPTKNRVTSLVAAVDSVLCQTYSEIELIVVDDGSSDDTQQILAGIRERDHRLKVIRNDRSLGAPEARNRAIQAASGEFVTGLDDDDLFEPFRIESFVRFWELLEDTAIPASCLYAQDRWRLNGRLESTTSRQGSTRGDQMAERNHVGNQIFAPKRHFIEAGLFDSALPAWQDYELFLRVMKRFGPARLVDVPSYIFDVSPRPDRISVHQEKVRRAYAVVCQKHFAEDPHGRQLLALQMFSDYYGIKPGLRDFCRFASDGLWLGGVFKMARAALRRSVCTAMVDEKVP